MLIKIKVKLKSNKSPDFGLGKGILAEQEISFKEKITKQNKARIFLGLYEQYEKLLESIVEYSFEEITNNKSKKLKL